MVKFRHKRTTKRNIAPIPVGEIVQAGRVVCLFCSMEIDKSIEDLSSHFMTRHIKGDNLEVPKFDSSKSVGQLFEVEHKIDPDTMQLHILIKNIYIVGLQINQVQLIYDSDKIAVLRHQWPVTLAINETIEVCLERRFLQLLERRYHFVIHAERNDEFMELQRMTINKSLIEMIKKKRAVKIEQVKSCWERFRYLDEYPPDTDLLKLFTDAFMPKERVEGLTASEQARYTDLVDFHKSKHCLTVENYTRSLRLLVEVEDLYTNCVLRKFNIPKTGVKRPWGKQCINISDVPDMPESIQEGDHIVLRRVNPVTQEMGEEVDLSIYKIADECIYFDQDRKKQLSPFDLFFVKFKKDRTCPRMEREALDKIDDVIIENVLFPKTYSQMEVQE